MEILGKRGCRQTAARRIEQSGAAPGKLKGVNPKPEDVPTADRERVFLSAEWRDLIMLNYEVDPNLLQAHVPAGTQLDSFEGRTYVSMVGFQFRRTKLLGAVPVPFHTDFDEVNLRFYVRRKTEGEVRKGVTFIAEIVPRVAVAGIARLLYGENYIHLPMRHRLSRGTRHKTVAYEWQLRNDWCKLSARGDGAPRPARAGSLEQFITEHYWGYSSGRGGSLEYHVAHPRWKVWTCLEAGLEGDTSSLYGSEFGKILARRPDSAFIADGSRLTVYSGKKLK